MHISATGWRSHRAAIQIMTGVLVVAGWAVAAVLGSSAISGPGIESDPEAPTSLRAAADQVQTTLLNQSLDQCARAADFEAVMRPKLAVLGFSSWQIRRSPGLADTDCVAFGLQSNQTAILLVSALAGSLREQLRTVAGASYDECLSKDEATRRVAQVVNASGLRNWEISGDAPVGGPLDRLDAIAEHVKSGCYIYSGTGMSPTGVRMFFVVGPS